MTDQIREQISALLDGELQPGEVGLLVRRMERDAELRRTFGSYVLAGEALRSPGGLVAGPGFAARVSAAIDEGEVPVRAAPEPVLRTPLRWRRVRRCRPTSSSTSRARRPASTAPASPGAGRATGYAPQEGTGSWGDDMTGLFRLHPDNTLQLKLSYWFDR